MEKSLSGDTFEYVGKKTGEIYSTFTPYGQTDEDIAYNLNAEYDMQYLYWRQHKDWGIDKPLLVRLTQERPES